MSIFDIESDVLRLLANAIESIQEAHLATKTGFVADHCENAIKEIKSAIGCELYGGRSSDESP